MGKQWFAFDTAIMICWATVWFVILDSWPTVASAALLERRPQDASTTSSSAQSQQQPGSQASQGVIVGLSAGVVVVVLTAITLIICFPPRKWSHSKSFRPVKPWIKQTTTTTVTSHSRSGSSDVSNNLTTISAAPLPMTRIANIDKRGRYIISRDVVPDAESHITRPSRTRQPAIFQRYSVHVTSNGNSAISSRNDVPLSPLPEEVRVAPKFLTLEILPTTPMNWPVNSMALSSLSTMPLTPGRPVLADRRGRPALQSIQVLAASSQANIKGKAKPRVYHH